MEDDTSRRITSATRGVPRMYVASCHHPSSRWLGESDSARVGRGLLHHMQGLAPQQDLGAPLNNLPFVPGWLSGLFTTPLATQVSELPSNP